MADLSPTNNQVSENSNPEDTTKSSDIQDIRKRYRSSDSIIINTSPSSINPTKKRITDLIVITNSLSKGFDQSSDSSLDQYLGHSVDACASTEINKNGESLPLVVFSNNFNEIADNITQTTSTTVSTNTHNNTIHDYLDLFTDQSSFSAHISNLSTTSKYEVESFAQPDSALTLPTSTHPLPALVEPSDHNATDALALQNLDLSLDNTPPVSVIITNFIASLQHQPSGDAVTASTNPPVPPQPPIIIEQPFPETDIVNTPPPPMPEGVAWPLEYKFEPARAMAGPLLSDLSKAIKSERRSDFLREALARDTLPLWSFGLEPIPAHWITSQTTKDTITKLLRTNARALTTAVITGMQAESNLNRETFRSRLEYVNTNENISPAEKQATSLALPWMQNLSLNQINNTLHNQWTFLASAQPSDAQIQAKWLKPPTNNTPSTSNKAKSSANRPNAATARPRPPATNNNQRRRERPTTTHRNRSRSRSPRPSASHHRRPRNNSQDRHTSAEERQYREFLEFKLLGTQVTSLPETSLDKMSSKTLCKWRRD